MISWFTIFCSIAFYCILLYFIGIHCYVLLSIVMYCCGLLFIVVASCSIVVYYSNNLWLQGCQGALGHDRLEYFRFSGVPFFSLFSCTYFFNKKITFVGNWTPKMTPKSIPNLALDLLFWFSAHAVFAALRSVFNGFHCFHLFKNTTKKNWTKTKPWKHSEKA